MNTQSITHGRSIMVSDNNGAIAASKSCTLTVKAEKIETCSPQGAGTLSTTKIMWAEYVGGKKSWNVSLSYLVLNHADEVTRVGNSYTLTIEDEEGNTLQGQALCTECKITATRGNLAQGSFAFQGSGELEAVVSS